MSSVRPAPTRRRGHNIGLVAAIRREQCAQDVVEVGGKQLSRLVNRWPMADDSSRGAVVKARRGQLTRLLLKGGEGGAGRLLHLLIVIEHPLE